MGRLYMTEELRKKQLEAQRPPSLLSKFTPALGKTFNDIGSELTGESYVPGSDKNWEDRSFFEKSEAVRKDIISKPAELIKAGAKKYNDFWTKNSLATNPKYRERSEGGIGYKIPLLEKYNDPNTSEKEKIEIRNNIVTDDIEWNPILKTLNTEEAKKVTGFIAEHSSNLGVKSYAARQTVLSFGKKSYKENLDKLLADRNDTNNGMIKKVAYGLQDSGVQSAIGVLLNFVPFAGKALSTSFFGAISAESQRKEKGRIEKVAPIGIDIVGDNVLSDLSEQVLKQGGKGLYNGVKNFAKGGITEGSTEVLQTIGKLSNDYLNATSDEARATKVDELKKYIKEGGLAEEFLVGGVSGGAISSMAGAVGAPAALSSEKQAQIGQLEQESIVRSKKEYQDAQNEGLAQLQVDGKLNPKIVNGRVNDIAMKIDLKIEKGKGDVFKKAIEGKDFKDYDEFASVADKQLRESLTEEQYLEINPQLIPTKSKEEREKEFDSLYKTVPQNVKDTSLGALNTKLTTEDISSLSDRDAMLLGMVLDKAENLGGANVEIIQDNIKTIQDSGVEIPGLELIDTKVESQIEKPAETVTLPTEVKTPAVKQAPVVVKEEAKPLIKDGKPVEPIKTVAEEKVVQPVAKIESKPIKERKSEIKYQKMTEKEEARMDAVGNAPYRNILEDQTSAEEAVATFKKYLPEVPVEIVKRIVTPEGGRAWGATLDEVVQFVQNPKKNTATHEVVHKFIKNYLTKKEYGRLIKAVAKERGVKESVADHEEWLADNFILHIKEKKMQAKDPLIKRAIRWLAKQIKNLTGKGDKIKSFYNDIIAKKRPSALKKLLNDYSVNKGEVKYQTKESKVDLYKEMLSSVGEKAEQALSEIYTDLDQSTAGIKSFNEGTIGGSQEVVGVNSTFPKWMPEGTRTRKTIDAILPLIKSIDSIKIPTSKNQASLMEAILDKLDGELGINTSDIREDMFEETTTEKESSKKKEVSDKGALRVSATFNEVWKSLYGVEPSSNLAKLVDENSATIAEAMAKRGFVLGKKLVRDKFRGKIRAKLWQQKKDFQRKREAILSKFKKKELTRKNLRKALLQLTKDFPINIKRDLLSQERVFNIKTGKQLSLVLDSIERMRAKVLLHEELGKMRQQVVATIINKRLEKTENIRRAMKLPKIKNMNMDQLLEFKKVVEEAELEDVFLSQRQIETLSNTELSGIKTLRESREKLSLRTGKTIEELSNIKVSVLDRFRFDAALAEANPFYGALVEDTYRETIQADMRSLEMEDKVNALLKEARKSRSRGVLDVLIPTDKKIFEYLESEKKEAVAKTMTMKELQAAEFIMNEYSKMRDYLVSKNMLEKYMNNYITHIRKGFLETFKDDGLAKAFKGIFEQQKQDEANFKILSDTGEILPLEKFFRFSMRRTGDLDPTKNIAKAFMVYKKTFETKVALDAIMPKFDVWVSALTPAMKTKSGLEMDRSLKTFYNSWMNNRKGRKTDFGGIIPVGSKLDTSFRALKALTTVLDLGFSVPVGVASIAGEEAVTFVSIGPKKMALATKRMATKKGREIIKKNRTFIGKEIVQDFSEAGDTYFDKGMKAMFVLFRVGNLLANKQFLLGSLTEKEFNSGEISPERLAQLKKEMGRWRVVEGSSSILGSTSTGKLLTQYKTWAVPVLRTTISNLKYVSKNIKNGGLKSEQSKELLRATLLTATILLMIKVNGDDEEDDSFVGKIKSKIVRETLTILQAVDPTLFTGEPRTLAFVDNIASSLKQLVLLEKYSQSRKDEYKKGQLKGPKKLIRTITPSLIKNLK